MMTTALAVLQVTLLAGGQEATPKIEDLAWMAGTWLGDDEGTAAEEHWIPPRGGAMLGVHRDVREGRMVFFEFLRIELVEGKLTYLASPRGRPATAFPAKSVEPRKVVFENPQHDFPQRILYWLDAQGALHARIEGPRGGKESAKEWVWRRAP
jgi:hypothetical protein